MRPETQVGQADPLNHNWRDLKSTFKPVTLERMAHIGMIYWAKPKTGSLILASVEHHDLRWCSAADLETLRPAMSKAVRWYCRKAIEEVSTLPVSN